MAEGTQPCRVCRTGRLEPFAELDGKVYRRCRACDAVMLDAAHFPGAAEEHARYRRHENDPDDPGYRRFLARLAVPLLPRLAPASEGLDYGCGPGPALARMLEEAGHRVRLFDPFFHADATALHRTYDFITCSEVAEHFHAPAREFDLLHGLLRPGGWLAVMTAFRPADVPFERWHYRRDPTHVVFYRAESFRRIAADRGMGCAFPAPGVALLRRAAASAGARPASPTP